MLRSQNVGKYALSETRKMGQRPPLSYAWQDSRTRRLVCQPRLCSAADRPILRSDLKRAKSNSPLRHKSVKHSAAWRAGSVFPGLMLRGEVHLILRSFFSF